MLRPLHYAASSDTRNIPHFTGLHTIAQILQKNAFLESYILSIHLSSVVRRLYNPDRVPNPVRVSTTVTFH
ncbi:hypothetical protein KsCSTR_34220 [Candidatus Kuenenia stuttgartiensis]|uniref:Uncharacterized protein n=1 Tax=Kuenenia stuttgartiensis TaxID=174633 RepID=Q1Q481_KUEST|nr:hypothetical protein KsCSTR_34220 [Candidatus Kuenenia stuttgartiensis]CAJ74821.1 unknown protein [Candidatus Kuenenia stuttgartiensis]